MTGSTSLLLPRGFGARFRMKLSVKLSPSVCLPWSLPGVAASTGPSPPARTAGLAVHGALSSRRIGGAA